LFRMVLALLVAAATAKQKSGGGFCVYNNAFFVMRYRGVDARTGVYSNWTEEFSAYKQKCLIPGAGNVAAFDLENGDIMTLESQPELGRLRNSSDTMVFDASTADVVNYKCTGTTLNYACKIGIGENLKNATQAVAEFVKGFTAGLSDSLGFDKCITDLDGAFDDAKNIATYLQKGFNDESTSTILQSFVVTGKLLLSIAEAIKNCVTAAKGVASKIKDVGDILTANVAQLIQTVVSDAIHIYNDRTELTADSKAVSAAWNNGDYETSGASVGRICGILMENIGR